MNVIYNIATRAYFLGISLASRFGHRKAQLMQEGRRDWAKRLEQQVDALRRQASSSSDGQLHLIWFHAASLGEFEQGRPLIEQLRERYPQYRILQTFFSPSGYEVRKNYKGADIICYLPYDRVSDCRRFLDIVRPEQVIFVKYEFWGNILEELHRRQVPTYLVSGIFRERQVFFKPWGGMMRPVLGMFRHLFVQDEESRRLLEGIGVGNVTICGDTRFDRVLSICSQAKQLAWAEAFRNRFVLVAGSSWPKDEDILLPHFNKHPEMKLIIAPHEIHEEHIQSIIGKLSRPYMRYSEMKPVLESGDESAKEALCKRLSEEVDCLIIDAIGFLSSIYRYGDAAYIGGGFGVGIHNTLEAAVYGIPVVFGPNHQAFREALGLIEAGGGFPVSDASGYDRIFDRFMTDAVALSEAGSKAGAYVKENSGASDVIFKSVFG